MTTFSMTIPLARPALHIPRRDLVLDSADDVTIEFLLLASDNPNATPLDLVGTGERLRMLVWSRSYAWDYGLWGRHIGTVLWSAYGVVQASPAGRVDLDVPRVTAVTWRGRLGYSVQLDNAGATSTIATGVLNVTTSAAFVLGDVLTDDFNNVLTDAGGDVEL